jgi:hypothetical protein
MAIPTFSLRVVCALAPYAVAGLRFGRGPHRAFGVALAPAAQFAPEDLRALFADPSTDVSAGSLETGFLPVVDELDLERVAQQFHQALQAIASLTPPPQVEAEQNTSTAAGAGEERPAPEDNARGSPGDAAATATVTVAAEVRSGLAAGQPADPKQPVGDQTPPPVVTSAPAAKRRAKQPR